MMDTSSKIMAREALMELLAQWREEEAIVVFTNGCFDLLHPGHLDNLEQARSLGTHLVVGLNSDASVQRLKGKDRPIHDQHFRQRMLAALACVDAVCLFEEDTPAALIQAVRPDILVKGGDYRVHEVVGHETVLGYGGEVKIVPLLPGYSTTEIIANIRKRGR